MRNWITLAAVAVSRQKGEGRVQSSNHILSQNSSGQREKKMA